MSDEFENEQKNENETEVKNETEADNTQYRMSFRREEVDSGNSYENQSPDPAPYINPNTDGGGDGNGKKNNNFLGIIIAVLVIAAIVGGLIGLAKLTGADKEDNKETTVALSKEEDETKETDETKEKETEAESEETKPQTTLSNSDVDTTEIVTATVLDVSDVVYEVMPSIVSVTNKTMYSSNGNINYWSWYFNGGSRDDYTASGAGSGVVIAQTEKELMIATNAHVVLPEDYSSYGLSADKSEYEVTFFDETAVKAYLKGYDKDMDLAVLVCNISEMDKETLESIKIATVGDSGKLRVGNGVIAIGNALGYGQSVTVGYVSALNRELTINKVSRHLLQIDAAINPGNSGGGLFDVNGRLIGINSAKYSSTEVEGMGFAIPISEAESILTDIMNNETVIREKVTDEDKVSYLGITSEMQYMQAYDGQGAFVSGVVVDGPADKAGIMAYDIITELNGTEVKSWNGLLDELAYYEGGETIEVTYYTLEISGGRREYVEKKTEVTLGFKKDYKDLKEEDIK